MHVFCHDRIVLDRDRFRPVACHELIGLPAEQERAPGLRNLRGKCSELRALVKTQLMSLFMSAKKPSSDRLLKTISLRIKSSTLWSFHEIP